MKEKLSNASSLTNNQYDSNNQANVISINSNHHLRHNSCNINAGNNDPLMKQLMSKPKAYDRTNSKEKDLFRTPSYRYGNDAKMKQFLMQKLPAAPKSIIITNEMQYDSTTINSHNPMSINKTKGNIEGNFPIISQQALQRTNTINANNNKDTTQFNKTTTAGIFGLGTKIKKNTISKGNSVGGIVTTTGLNKGKKIDSIEENNDSFLNEVVNFLHHAELPLKQKEEDNKHDKEKEKTVKKNEEEEEVDPRINFEKINQLNKQRPLTSYGGLMARKRSLQNSLSRQQSSKTRCDQSNDINNNYNDNNQENEIQKQNYPYDD